MRILGIIPARFASTRFPGKPLVNINGKSMVRRVYDQALKSNSLRDVIVATDDERIFDHVSAFGGQVAMTSPNHKNGTERCGEAINSIDENFDFVVNIQGDEPFVSPKQIDLICSRLNKDVEMATLMKKVTDHNKFTSANCIKVVFDTSYNALYFSRSSIPNFKNSRGDDSFFKHIGVYAYRSDILKRIVLLPPTPLELAESLEQLRWLESGYKIKVFETSEESHSIDTPEDLEHLLENFGLQKTMID